MKAICEDKKKGYAKWLSCFLAANQYYYGVHIGGGSAYDTSASDPSTKYCDRRCSSIGDPKDKPDPSTPQDVMRIFDDKWFQ